MNFIASAAVGVCFGLGACALGIIIKRIRERKKNTPAICDSCIHLEQYYTKGKSTYKYRCRRIGGFDTAPEYCAKYCKRKSDEDSTLVHCKDCKHYVGGLCSNLMTITPYEPDYVNKHDDDFCSIGERKDKE